MICSKCGTNNSKSSKFCRECGKRLILESLEMETGVATEPIDAPDQQSVSDLLYETLKLYERGNLDEAFTKCRLTLGIDPASTSARSLLALIYEKKADLQMIAGQAEDARDYLSAAIRQMERVLEANPESVADQEKLRELKAKLYGHGPEKPRSNVPDQLAARLKSVPVPIAAAAGTFLFVLVILLLITSGHKKPATTAEAPQQPMQQVQQPPVGQNYAARQYAPPAGYQYQQQQSQPPADGAQQATQPTQPPVQQPPVAQQPPTVITYPPPQAPMPAYHQSPALPSVRSPMVTIGEPRLRPLNPLPGARPPVQPGAAKPKIEEPSSRPTPPPAASVEKSSLEEARKAYGRGDFASAAQLFQGSINSGSDTPENYQLLGTCLYNVGRKAESVAKFERAIQLFQARKSRGEGSAAAEQGIRTCRQFMDLARE